MAGPLKSACSISDKAVESKLYVGLEEEISIDDEYDNLLRHK
jgi:hypothetical protein